MSEDHGAEQGDVEGPLVCSLVLGMVAAEALTARCRPTSRAHPWIGTDDPVEEQWLQAEQNCKMQQFQDFQVGGSGKTKRS